MAILLKDTLHYKLLEERELYKTLQGKHPWKVADFVEYLRKRNKNDDDGYRYAYVVASIITGFTDELKIDPNDNWLKSAWKFLKNDKFSDKQYDQLDKNGLELLSDFKYTYDLRQTAFLRIWPKLKKPITNTSESIEETDEHKEFDWFLGRPGKENFRNLLALRKALVEKVLNGSGMSKSELFKEWRPNKKGNRDNDALLGRAVKWIDELILEFLVFTDKDSTASSFDLRLLQAMVKRKCDKDLIVGQLQKVENLIQRLPQDDVYYLQRLQLEQTRAWIDRTQLSNALACASDYNTLLMLQNACMVLNWSLSSKTKEKSSTGMGNGKMDAESKQNDLVGEVQILVNNILAWKPTLTPPAELYWLGMQILIGMVRAKNNSEGPKSVSTNLSLAYEELKGALSRFVHQSSKTVSDGVIHDSFTILNNYLNELINTGVKPDTNLIREKEHLFVLRCDFGDWSRLDEKTGAIRKIGAIDLRNLIMALLRDGRKADAESYNKMYCDRLDANDVYSVDFLELIVEFENEDDLEDQFINQPTTICLSNRAAPELDSLIADLRRERDSQKQTLAKAEAWVTYWKACFLLREFNLIIEEKEKKDYVNLIKKLKIAADREDRYLKFKFHMTRLAKQANQIKEVETQLQIVQGNARTVASKRSKYNSLKTEIARIGKNLHKYGEQLSKDQSVSKAWLLKKIGHTLKKIDCLINEIDQAIEDL
jgi:hypothetical protein